MKIVTISAVVSAIISAIVSQFHNLPSDIIEWLNGNQGFCMILLTIGLVYFSYRTCKIAAKNIKTMREIEQERCRPYMMLKTGIVAPCYCKISLINLGSSPAYDIVVKSNPIFCSSFANSEKTPIYFLNNRLASIGPRGELSCIFEALHDKGVCKKYEGSIEYRDSKGKIYNEIFVVDYSIYGKRGDTLPTENMTNDISLNLERINSTLISLKNMIPKNKGGTTNGN